MGAIFKVLWMNFSPANDSIVYQVPDKKVPFGLSETDYAAQLSGEQERT
jgi:hypothetical protein